MRKIVLAAPSACRHNRFAPIIFKRPLVSASAAIRPMPREFPHKIAVSLVTPKIFSVNMLKQKFSILISGAPAPQNLIFEFIAIKVSSASFA